jgi:hypothetical protein
MVYFSVVSEGNLGDVGDERHFVFDAGARCEGAVK